VRPWFLPPRISVQTRSAILASALVATCIVAAGCHQDGSYGAGKTGRAGLRDASWDTGPDALLARRSAVRYRQARAYTDLRRVWFSHDSEGTVLHIGMGARPPISEDEWLWIELRSVGRTSHGMRAVVVLSGAFPSQPVLKEREAALVGAQPEIVDSGRTRFHMINPLAVECEGSKVSVRFPNRGLSDTARAWLDEAMRSIESDRDRQSLGVYVFHAVEERLASKDPFAVLADYYTSVVAEEGKPFSISLPLRPDLPLVRPGDQ